MKILGKWVCWRPVDTDDGLRKKPTDVEKLEEGTIDDIQYEGRDSWLSYTEAVTKAQEHDELGGIQIRIDVSEDPFVIIDFDDCVDTSTGKIDPSIRKYLRMTDSYVELSPSGTGLHVIVQGDIEKQGWPDKPDPADGEIYDKYFITVTEDHVAGSSFVAHEDQALLDQYFEDNDVSWDKFFY